MGREYLLAAPHSPDSKHRGDRCALGGSAVHLRAVGSTLATDRSATVSQPRRRGLFVQSPKQAIREGTGAQQRSSPLIHVSEAAQGQGTWYLAGRLHRNRLARFCPLERCGESGDCDAIW
jgi:hypothetical protein